MKQLWSGCWVLLICSSFGVFGNVLEVPGTYNTIQAAIDTAATGDTVLVSPGTYVENIDLLGKKITVGSLFLTSGDTAYISQTVIDGGGSATNQSVVTFNRSENDSTLLCGFTITNGWAAGDHGGGITLSNGSSPRITDCRIINNAGAGEFMCGIGIACNAASPTFERCLIKNNSAPNNFNWDHYGGGIYLANQAAPTFTDCQIIDNQISVSVYWRNYGGGLFCDNSSPTFTNCEFSGNTADFGGAIEAINFSNIQLDNCTFANNYARSSGGAIAIITNADVQGDSLLFYQNQAGINGGAVFTENDGQATLQQSTITDNSAGSLGAGIFAASGTSPVLTNSIVFYNWSDEIYPADLSTISYSNVRGGYTGTGNIDADPLFCDWQNGDFSLAANSPCATAGSAGGTIGSDVVACNAVTPQSHRVPQDFSSIQEAILSAYQGDTILVSRGSYTENIDFWGRRVILTSNYIHSGDSADISQTVIDGGGATANQSVISFLRREDSLSVLQGLTLTNGYAKDDHGGGITLRNGADVRISDCRIINNTGAPEYWMGIGISCIGSAPLIERCLIKDNIAAENFNHDHFGAGMYLGSQAAPQVLNSQFIGNRSSTSIYWRNRGGAVYATNASPLFRNCYFYGNDADYGAAIEAFNSSGMEIQNCLVVNNYARADGGAIFLNGSDISITNSTFTINLASGSGGAIYQEQSNPIITNSILWQDSSTAGANEISVNSGTAVITYSNIQGGWSGEGNLDADPLFADIDDYYLSASSTLIDAGNPGSAFNDPEDPNNPGTPAFPALGALRNDIGVYGGPYAGTLDFITAVPTAGTTGSLLPKTLVLKQNYPNPFNPQTTFSFSLPLAGPVNLTVYNARGQKVVTLLSEQMIAGPHTISWQPRNIASGVYFYRLQHQEDVVVKKALLLK